MGVAIRPLGIAFVAVLFSFNALSARAQDTWEVLDPGTTQDLNGVSFLSADIGYVVGDGIVLKTTDRGATWTDVSPGVAVEFLGVHFVDADTGVVVGRGGTIVRTEDGGATWATVPSGTSAAIFSVSLAGATGLAGAGDQTILRSEDQGVTWTVVQGGFFGGGFFGADLFDENVGMLIGENSIFQALAAYTSDGGATFGFTPFYFEEDGVGNEGLHRDVHQISAQEAVAVGRTFDFLGGISRTEDGGQTWTSELFDPTAGVDEFYGVDFVGATGYAVGRGGALLKSGDDGRMWASVPSGTTQDLNGVELASATTGYIVGDGGLILKGVLPPPVGNEPSGAGPSGLAVVGPNPTQDVATIVMTLPVTADASLAVFDVLGREVRRHAGVLSAGEHVFTFDGTGLPSGVYLVRLQAGSMVATERITLLR